MTKFYVRADGSYIGGFDGAPPPARAIEVPFPPAHAIQKWNGADWGPLPPQPPTPAETLDAAISGAGTLAALKAVLVGKVGAR